MIRRSLVNIKIGSSMNKEISLSQAVAELKSGMTVGIGGWGPRRKPMSVVREILRSDVKDLTVVAYGGPEIGMLWAAGLSVPGVPANPNPARVLNLSLGGIKPSVE